MDSILDSDDENYSTPSEEENITDFSESISDVYDSDCEEVDSNNESGEQVENNNESGDNDINEHDSHPDDDD